MYQFNQPIQQLLQFKSKSIKFKKYLVSVPDYSSLASILETMQTNSLQSVPVYKKGQDGKPRHYIGMISTSDILNQIVFSNVFDTLLIDTQESESVLYHRFMEQVQVLFSTPVSEIMNQHSRDYVFLKSDESVSKLIFYLKHQTCCLILNVDPVMSAALCDQEQLKCTRACYVMVTRTDVLKYLKHLYDTRVDLFEDLDMILSTKVSNVSLIHRCLESQANTFPVTIPTTFSALNAFRWMYLHGTSCLAIVDSHFRIAGNISSSDVRYININNLESLLLPITEYLEICRRNTKLCFDQIRMVSNEESVHDVIRMLWENEIHHIWIVNQDDKPIGLCSMRDILSLF